MLVRYKKGREPPHPPGKLLPEIVGMEVPAGATQAEFIAQLMQDEDVEEAFPDFELSLSALGSGAPIDDLVDVNAT